MNTFKGDCRFKLTKIIPCPYDDLFKKIFDNLLNIPSSDELSAFENECKAIRQVKRIP
jgi:hypothetical protein